MGHRHRRCSVCAMGWLSRRTAIKSHFLSAISPWIESSPKFDIIRDKLEERAIALVKEPELVS